MPINPNQDTMEARLMTALGKRPGRLCERQANKRRKSVETHKTRTDKRIKMVFLQTEW